MSTDLFQIICSTCGSKLNAKISLIGQTRNCPKCKTPMLIQREESAAESAELTPIIVNTPSIAPILTGPTLGAVEIENLPKHLESHNRYFIIGLDRIVAVWETGKSWQVNVGSGFAPAKKNFSAIPDQGVFAFVELVMTSTGIPCELNIFKISQRGALTSLYRDEGEILHKIDSIGALSKNQKNMLFNQLRQIFMFDVLAEAKEVVNYLNLP